MFDNVNIDKYIRDVELIRPTVERNARLNKIVKVCFFIIFPLLALKLAVKTSQGEFELSLITSNILTILVGVGVIVNYSKTYKPIMKRLELLKKDMKNPQYITIQTKLCDIQKDNYENAFSLLPIEDRNTVDAMYFVLTIDGFFRCNRIFDFPQSYDGGIPVEITYLKHSKIIAQAKIL